MAISNVGELKSELSAYLFHARLANRYDNCIQLFEVAANSRLRVLPMEKEVYLTTATANGNCALPTDYLAWRSVKKTALPTEPELEYVHIAYLPPITSNRLPAVFTIRGAGFLGRPVDNTADAWDFNYYQKIPTLAGAANNITNWLLTEYPSAYLYGVLTELAAVQRNAEMAQLYKARRDETFAEITQRYAMTTGATSPQVRTAEYF